MCFLISTVLREVARRRNEESLIKKNRIQTQYKVDVICLIHDTYNLLFVTFGRQQLIMI